MNFFGEDCSFYDTNPDRCDDSTSLDDVDFQAATMCCACGGTTLKFHIKQFSKLKKANDEKVSHIKINIIGIRPYLPVTLCFHDQKIYVDYLYAQKFRFQITKSRSFVLKEGCAMTIFSFEKNHIVFFHNFMHSDQHFDGFPIHFSKIYLESFLKVW